MGFSSGPLIEEDSRPSRFVFFVKKISCDIEGTRQIDRERTFLII